jgi:DNA-3-methyladenine glycosylase I
MRRRFDYLSKITSYHFLTDIGMPVLKPDRVIRRIFYRLGLIEDESESEAQLLDSVYQGRKFVQATGYPIRYIDIVFVAYGQVYSTGTGIGQGICLKDHPRCEVCGVRDDCRYFAAKTDAAIQA